MGGLEDEVNTGKERYVKKEIRKKYWFLVKNVISKKKVISRSTCIIYIFRIVKVWKKELEAGNIEEVLM